MVTCMSRHSRNRHIGVEIGKGRRLPDILAEMVMVAEGVETELQRAHLARMGADYLQGYLFSKPVPAADLEAWAARA